MHKKKKVLLTSCNHVLQDRLKCNLFDIKNLEFITFLKFLHQISIELLFCVFSIESKLVASGNALSTIVGETIGT